MTRLRQIYNYYSSWNHLKQLFFIPYRRRPKNSAKVTLRRSGSKTEVEKSGSSKDGASVTSSEGGRRTQVGVKQVPPTSPAKEVEEYLFNEVYFTHSKEPRIVRPKTLQFRVGQVVKHKSDKYHGVIVGWDTVAKVTSTSIHVHIHIVSHYYNTHVCVATGTRRVDQSTLLTEKGAQQNW